jgi:hypothetical protein
MRDNGAWDTFERPLSPAHRLRCRGACRFPDFAVSEFDAYSGAAPENAVARFSPC